MSLLREYRFSQLEQRFAMGDRWHNRDFVFTQENGEPMHPDSVTDWLTKFSKRHDLPHINAHAFRHTMASILYFNGVDSISISKRLGHAQPSTTTNIYAHIIEEADKKNADIIADVFLKKAWFLRLVELKLNFQAKGKNPKIRKSSENKEKPPGIGWF